MTLPNRLRNSSSGSEARSLYTSHPGTQLCSYIADHGCGLAQNVGARPKVPSGRVHGSRIKFLLILVRLVETVCLVHVIVVSSMRSWTGSELYDVRSLKLAGRKRLYGIATTR